MVRARLQGINTVRKRLSDGTVRLYYYHRATGLPLSGKPGSSEFLRDYGAAEKTMLDRLAGIFNGLVRDYILSPEFEKLRDSTQREYKRMLTKAAHHPGAKAQCWHENVTSKRAPPAQPAGFLFGEAILNCSDEAIRSGAIACGECTPPSECPQLVCASIESL